MNNNENVREMTVDEVLTEISELHFERFCARLKGYEERVQILNEEIDGLSRLLDESVKENK